NSATFRAADRACQKLMPGGTPSPAQAKKALDAALKFSACMRKNGVPNFPDPQSDGSGRIRLSIRSGQGLAPRAPALQAGREECPSLMPGGKGGFATANGPGKP